MLKHIILITILTALVFSAVLYGFISGGSPFEIRNQKMDQAQITKIQSLSTIIDQYFQVNQRLPQTLNDIFNNDQSKNYDLQTNNSFEYIKNGDFSYNICTNFSSDAPKQDASRYSYYNDSINQKYSNYKKGRYCFEYPVKNNIPSFLTPISTPYLSPSPQPQISSDDYSKDGITNFTKDGAPYVRIIGTLVGIPNQSKFQLSTQTPQSDHLVVTVLYDDNTISFDKQNLRLKISAFVIGDRIMIESNVMRGQNNYETKSIQNLTR